MVYVHWNFLIFFWIWAFVDAAYYCICDDGLSDAIYQKNIDYACGAGADCIPIMQNGPCFQPNTVKDHCNVAVNSYYQRNGQVQGSCNFSNTATLAQDPPPTISECVYPSMPRAVEKPIIHFSLSIKITVATGLVIMVIGLLKLFQSLNEGKSHQEAANHTNGPVEIEANTAGSPSTVLDIKLSDEP
ncbi:carbohydrate-binding X8 domain-containing protein-like isoform X1 [Olea europaea var. sylvestris]|uniref:PLASMODESMATA CALLOSE-BINDING PROTEIN 3-like n=1 Tax=Olea europaea subsp. europaea TaxID=158383 RepID=A0A8S0U3W6_OLEEU|nr:carbohydrate-binding X8 domain-containing protein-like isoform X1 [Olea europaea var. sylvestris]CAA3013038.1 PLASMODESMATA CALLOSE-BINDING PROTEIN 3-like [Olea europaea subsp. europaea]